MRQQNGLHLRRRNLKPAHFDQLLLPVHNVPFSGGFIAACNVPCLQPTVVIKGGAVRRDIIKVAGCYGGATDAELTGDIVCSDISTLVID